MCAIRSGANAMDFRESERVETSDVATMELAKNDAPVTPESKGESKGESAPDTAPAAKLNDGSEAKVHARRFAIVTDASRDALLTDFGKETLQARYLLRSEERRVGKERVITCRCRWSRSHYKKKIKRTKKNIQR